MRCSEEVLTRSTLKTAAGQKVRPGQPYIAGEYYQVEMALYDVDGMQLTDEVYTGVAGVDDGTQKTPDESKPTALALTARLISAGTESTIKSGAIPGYAPAVAVEDVDELSRRQAYMERSLLGDGLPDRPFFRHALVGASHGR